MKRLSKEKRAEELLAKIEAHGGTVRIEQMERREEFRIGNLSRLPQDVFTAALEADGDVTNGLYRLICARKPALRATV